MSDGLTGGGEEIRRADDVGRARSRPSGRHLAGMVLIGVLVPVAILNREQVGIDLVVGTIHVSLIVVVALSGLVGFGAGWLFFRRREKRRRQET